MITRWFLYVHSQNLYLITCLWNGLKKNVNKLCKFYSELFYSKIIHCQPETILILFQLQLQTLSEWVFLYDTGKSSWPK